MEMTIRQGPGHTGEKSYTDDTEEWERYHFHQDNTLYQENPLLSYSPILSRLIILFSLKILLSPSLSCFCFVSYGINSLACF